MGPVTGVRSVAGVRTIRRSGVGGTSVARGQASRGGQKKKNEKTDGASHGYGAGSGNIRAQVKRNCEGILGWSDSNKGNFL